jgi:hypothetical protein
MHTLSIHYVIYKGYIINSKDYALATSTVIAVGTAIGGDFSKFSVTVSFGGVDDSGELEMWFVFIFFFFFIKPAN